MASSEYGDDFEAESPEKKPTVPPALAGSTAALPAVSEATVRKVLLAKGALLENCAAIDKSGVGLVTAAELAKQLQETAGCTASEAESLVWSGGAWREIVPNGKGQMVDYRLFCLRVRLVDKEEAGLLKSLSNADLQAARMAVLTCREAFVEALSQSDGPVSARQCEQLLKENAAHVMGKQHASALCACPGSAAAQRDMRVLADELELVDTQRLHRGPLIHRVILDCVRDFAASNESKSSEALAAGKDGSSVLAPDKFASIFANVDADAFCSAHALLEAPKMPHMLSKCVLTPMLTAATGALRQDLDVNFETFTGDFSIAHDSEIRVLRAGRRDSLQRLRRKVLKARKSVEKELVTTNTVEHLKKVLIAKSPGLSEREATEFCADVPTGSDGKQDALEHIKKLQFSEILGTELDSCAEALFEKHDDLCSSCETKEPAGKEGSIRMEDFADALDLVNLDEEIAKKVRQVLSDEGVELVAWRELLECRMRVLSWRELEVLKKLRDKAQQEIRLKLYAAAARVFVALAEDGDAEDMVATATVKAKIVSVGGLEEDEAEHVVQMLALCPLSKPGKINSRDVLGLRGYMVRHDADSHALAALMGSRRGFLDACCGSEGGPADVPAPKQTGPVLSVTALRSAMHRVHLPAWAIDAVMGCADRAHKDVSKVPVGSLLSHMAVVTCSERQRLEMLADGRLQLARLALLKAAPSGDSCPKERLGPLFTELIKKVDAASLTSPSLRAALHEGIALALLSMKESHMAADKKGSLTSEDLVASFSAVICDFEPTLPFHAAADQAAGSTDATGADAERKEARKVSLPKKGAKDSMSPAQRVFYEKIIKPRKPGIQEMMDLLRGLPASIITSPLRELQRAGLNLPSAAVLEGAVQDWESASSVLNLTVSITGAEGIPAMRKQDLEVVERRARVCLVHVASKSFVAGAHTVPVSRKGDKDKEATDWKFSNDEKKGNPFMVRAPVGADLELYIELSLVVRKKGATTQGQQAISSGDIKEFSAGFGCLRLASEVKKGSVNLPLFGGTPWGKVQVQAKDLEGQKKSGLFARFKAQVSHVSIKVEMMKDKEVADLGKYMPPVLVCHPWIKEGLAEFSKLQHEANSSTFPIIMDSYDLMRSFVVRYNAANKQDKAAAFRDCVSLYYPIVHMDSSRMPKYLDLEGSPERKAREEVLEKFDKTAKSKEKLVQILERVEHLLVSETFRGAPFCVDELMVH